MGLESDDLVWRQALPVEKCVMIGTEENDVLRTVFATARSRDDVGDVNPTTEAADGTGELTSASDELFHCR